MASSIDENHLEKYVCGDDGLRDEILTIFIEQLNSLVDRLQINASDSDWHHVCHALKGASRGVGAWALGDFGEAGESLLLDGGDEARVMEARRKLVQEIESAAAACTEDARILRG